MHKFCDEAQMPRLYISPYNDRIRQDIIRYQFWVGLWDWETVILVMKRISRRGCCRCAGFAIFSSWQVLTSMVGRFTSFSFIKIHLWENYQYLLFFELAKFLDRSTMTGSRKLFGIVRIDVLQYLALKPYMATGSRQYYLCWLGCYILW